MKETIKMTETKDFIKTVEKIGFKPIYDEKFKGHEARTEKLFIYWESKRGILLCFDTFGIHVNSGNFYYNWIPNDKISAHLCTSSGGFEKHNEEMVWVGYHNCRENLKEDINDLNKHGKFVVPWIKQPFLSLLHYTDQNNLDILDLTGHKAINEKRINILPIEVQTAIKGITNK